MGLCYFGHSEYVVTDFLYHAVCVMHKVIISMLFCGDKKIV